MRSMVRQIAFSVILLGASAAPQPARAGAKEEARQHYDRAIELVDDGQLEGAIVEFQRSYDLTHHFAVLYNIGQVFVSLAKPVEAVDAYERYLVGGGRSIPAARRAEVEQEIARQKARIATLEIRGLPEGAVVRVDGKDIGKSPIAAPVRVGVGTHAIAASAEGYDPAETEVTVAGEDRRTVELRLKAHIEKKAEPEPAPTSAAKPAPAAAAPLPAFSAPPQPPLSAVTPVPEATVAAVNQPPANARHIAGTRVAGLVTGAAGLVGLASGTVCWLVARSRHDQAVTDWNQGGPSDGKATSLQGQAQNYATAATISFIAGGALAALGVVLYVVGAPAGQPATPDTHVHLMPAFGPGFASLNAGGTW